MSDQKSLFGITQRPDFDGVQDYTVEDRQRMNTLADRVFDCMSNGEPWTLRQLEDATGGQQPSIQARIREFKKRFGVGYTKKEDENKRGLWWYKLELNQ